MRSRFLLSLVLALVLAAACSGGNDPGADLGGDARDDAAMADGPTADDGADAREAGPIGIPCRTDRECPSEAPVCNQLIGTCGSGCTGLGCMPIGP